MLSCCIFRDLLMIMIQVFLGAKGQQHGHKISRPLLATYLDDKHELDNWFNAGYVPFAMVVCGTYYGVSILHSLVSASSVIVSEVDETPAGWLLQLIFQSKQVWTPDPSPCNPGCAGALQRSLEVSGPLWVALSAGGLAGHPTWQWTVLIWDQPGWITGGWIRCWQVWRSRKALKIDVGSGRDLWTKAWSARWVIAWAEREFKSP